MAVSDTLMGCGSYYEGNRYDPKTGIGNWYVSQMIPVFGGYLAGNFREWGIPESGANVLNLIYGDELHISGDVYWMTDIYQWTSGSRSYTFAGYNGTLYSGNDKIEVKALVRCERLLNTDILTLSKQYVELPRGTSTEVIFYTDAERIDNITDDDIISLHGSDPAFTVTSNSNTNSGRIQINCKNDAKSGSITNLLIHTVGKVKSASTYKIIKLKVK